MELVENWFQEEESSFEFSRVKEEVGMFQIQQNFKELILWEFPGVQVSRTQVELLALENFLLTLLHISRILRGALLIWI